MPDREDLIAQAKLQPDPKASEVAELVQHGSTFQRLIGMLVRENETAQSNFAGLDLVTDEGRLRAIKTQGEALGRNQILERIIDLVLEGTQDEHGTERAE